MIDVVNIAISQSDPKTKAAKEDAFKSTIAWFKEHI
jgi:hypothetical protein